MSLMDRRAVVTAGAALASSAIAQNAAPGAYAMLDAQFTSNQEPASVR